MQLRGRGVANFKRKRYILEMEIVTFVKTKVLRLLPLINGQLTRYLE